MKIQKSNVKNKITVLNIILYIVLFSALLFIYLDINSLGNLDNLLAIASFSLLLFLSYLGSPYFMYDSQGEILMLQNEKALPLSLGYQRKADFPKSKLLKFNIYHFLFRKVLEINISSKRTPNGISKMRFNISYLTKKEIRDLKLSLEKIIKINREEKQNQQ